MDGHALMKCWPQANLMFEYQSGGLGALRHVSTSHHTEWHFFYCADVQKWLCLLLFRLGSHLQQMKYIFIICNHEP